MREAVILFIKLFLALVFTAMPILALAFLATSIALPIRIGLAVFIVACGLAVAFGRFSFGSENAEEEVTDRPHPMESTQVTRREAGAISRGVMPRGCDITDAPVKPMTPIPPKPSLAAVRRPRTRMEFDATPGYFAGAISLAFLAMLIAWALMGGLNEILGVHTMFH